MDDNTNILIIEDDPDIRDGIRLLLEGESFQITEAATGSEGLEKLDKDIDLVILDLMLPDISGLNVCEHIRKVSYIPILILTAKALESDKWIGLMAGADDYLTKPFSYSELLARIRALLRRYRIYDKKDAPSAKADDAYLNIGTLRISQRSNEVYRNGQEILLTELEYQILLLLMQHPTKIFSARNLYESIWNEPYFYNCNGTVLVHIRNLRVKLEEDPGNPKYIKTVWGKGYRLGENA